MSHLEAGPQQRDHATDERTVRAALIGLPDAVFDAAFRLAHVITRDDDSAFRAVAAGCSQVLSDRPERPRPVRLELLDAVRRCADRLAPMLEHDVHREVPPAWMNVHAAADREIRDALALALAGHCSITDIAEILTLSRSDVCRRLRDGLLLVSTTTAPIPDPPEDAATAATAAQASSRPSPV